VNISGVNSPKDGADRLHSGHGTVYGSETTATPESGNDSTPTEAFGAGSLMAHEVPSMSVEEMESHWNVTMNFLQKSADTRKLRAFLLVAKPYRVIGDTLYIVYTQASTFHKSNAEKEVDLLEKALKKVTGYNLKARCIFAGEEQGLQQAATAAERGIDDVQPHMSIQPTTREDAHQDPIVQKALKIFGGKVIQIENE
jgi:hypothetical protein